MAGFSPALAAHLADYPSYEAAGPERVDTEGNRYVPFLDVATGWRGLLVLWVDGGLKVYWGR